MSSIRQRRKRQRQLRNGIILVTAIVTLLVLAYVAVGCYFKTHFLPRTRINGVKVGGMKAEEAETAIGENEADYTLIVVDRDKQLYTIEGADIGADYMPDGAVKEALLAQDSGKWIKALFSGNRIDVKTPMKYDSAKLKTAVAALSCFSGKNKVEPQNAYIVEEDGTYRIEPETQGNQMILDKVVEEIGAAVSEGDGEVYLSDAVYVQPEITAESPEVAEPMALIEKYSSARIVYQIADYDETLEGETLSEMILVDEDYNVTLDDEAITRYVQSLATKYNTYGDERNFKTTMGDTVVIGGGDYGWVIDKEAEAELLKENIMAGGTTQRQPVYSQTAVVEGLDDIGDTYLEIDYTNQHLYYYEEGVLMMDTEIVSGNIAKGNGSPDGIFKVVYKQSPAVLVGEDYESNVDYFIVFAYNVGVHDASWRDKFGGSIYKTSGSHGCVNVPRASVEKLYGMIENNTPVVAYYREKVELTSTSAQVSNAYSYVDSAELTPTTPAEQPAETPAAETPAEQPAETPAAETPAEQPAETPAEQTPAEQTAETPAAETPAEQPAETPAAE